MSLATQVKGGNRGLHGKWCKAAGTCACPSSSTVKAGTGHRPAWPARPAAPRLHLLGRPGRSVLLHPAAHHHEWEVASPGGRGRDGACERASQPPAEVQACRSWVPARHCRAPLHAHAAARRAAKCGGSLRLPLDYQTHSTDCAPKLRSTSLSCSAMSPDTCGQQARALLGGGVCMCVHSG